MPNQDRPTPAAPPSASPGGLPSLVEDIPLPPERNGAKVRVKRGPTAAELKLRAVMGKARAASERKTVRRVAIVAAAVALLVGGAWTTVALWPRPVPNYLEDPLDQILDFTLITGDFNKLPLEKRLELIKDLVTRLKNSSAEDSMLMAMFASRIEAKARKQLETNAQQLAMDMLDSYAMDYADVPESQRTGYLDDKILEFTRLMEELSGERTGLSDDDSERLAQIKRQAKRDEERLRRDGAGPMEADRVAGFLRFLNEGPGQQTNLPQQARMTRFTRDMVRHLRGQDVSTGRPRDPG